MVILTAHLSDRSMVRSTSALVSQRVRVRVTVRPNPTLPLPLPLTLPLTLQVRARALAPRAEQVLGAHRQVSGYQASS